MLERIDLLIPRAAEMRADTRSMDFLRSIRTQWIRKGNLSPGQTSWLERLEKRYSEEACASELAWISSFGDEKRAIALKIAHYYKGNPPYFENYVYKVMSEPTKFILSKREWDKFCENKYAKKIRKEYDSEKKFIKGDCVQIRKTNKIRKANYNSSTEGTFPQGALGDKTGFIIGVDSKPITRAAKGSRIYQVLLAGHIAPIYAYESDLKKKRRAKSVKND